MSKESPVTETMSASEARQHFAETINRVAKHETRVVVEKNGVPVAAIVPFSDIHILEHAAAKREEMFRILDEMRETFKDVPTEELEREAAKAIAEVRAEKRAEQEALLAAGD